jgi:hypothetical protein
VIFQRVSVDGIQKAPNLGYHTPLACQRVKLDVVPDLSNWNQGSAVIHIQWPWIEFAQGNLPDARTSSSLSDKGRLQRPGPEYEDVVVDDHPPKSDVQGSGSMLQ